MNEINTSTLDSLGLSARPVEKDTNKLGQEDFLKLMTTQLQNQDPFKPMENGEFMSQMAQFGTVSGIKDLQESFKTLAGSLSSNQSLEAASMVGRSVLVPADRVGLNEDGGLSGAVDLPQSAGSLNLSIYDSGGQLVKRIGLGSQPPGLVNYEWDGTTDEGYPAVPGTYKVVAQAVVGGENIEASHLAEARVESVTFSRGGEGLKLNLAGQGEVGFNKVRQIR